jgi:two-component system sensor histidine kinase KdpD
VDELAHTNGPGTRHPKRWQDIEELLANGIDVVTTLNVQHLESLNDIVARITGVWVNETVPDSVFDSADEIELIDLPTEDLLQRLAEGKVYVGDGAGRRAAENFFKKSTLGALRELALRVMAERVDAQNEQFTAAMGLEDTPIGHKILVLVGHDPLSQQLIRQTKLMAMRSKALWSALYIRTERHDRLGAKARQRVEDHLKLAEKLGAQIVRLSGAYPVTQILLYARTNGFTRIVLGHRPMRPWRRLWRPSLSQALIERSAGIEISTITPEATSRLSRDNPKIWRLLMSTPIDYLLAGAVVGICTLIAFPFRDHAPTNDLTMIYLAGVVFVAARIGMGPSFLASVASVLSFNFVFTRPYYSLDVYDNRYYATFAFMLATSLLVGSLTARQGQNARLAQRGEQETQILYELARGLSAAGNVTTMAEAVTTGLNAPYRLSASIWIPSASGPEQYPPHLAPVDAKEMGAVRWVLENGQVAGRHTDTLPAAKGLYLPLTAGDEVLGAIGLIPRETGRRFTGAETQKFEIFSSLVAGALAARGRPRP